MSLNEKRPENLNTRTEIVLLEQIEIIYNAALDFY